jgi:biopolymer transport protein ExbD
MGMDLGASGGKKGRSHPEMNVTPLVDVVLVLLIIFMVVTPQLTAYFWIHIPDKPEENAAPPPPSSQQPIVVSIAASGQIRINQDVVSDTEFPVRLRRVLAARRDRKIFFDANNAAPYGRAVQVLDMARAGGAANIAVMTTAL